MTDRAINFVEIVDAVAEYVSTAADGDRIDTVDADGVVEVCRALYARVDERADPTEREFYMSPDARWAMEKRLASAEFDIAEETYLYRLIRSDVSMPDRTVLFARPDALALDGTVVDPTGVGIGTIAEDGA